MVDALLGGEVGVAGISAGGLALGAQRVGALGATGELGEQRGERDAALAGAGGEAVASLARDADGGGGGNGDGRQRIALFSGDTRQR